MKVNAVVKRGANDDGIVALAGHFRGTGHTLRFIEYMDVGHTNGWRLDDVVSADEIVEHDRRRLAARAARARPRRRDRPPLRATATAPARSASSPRSRKPFCGGCSRARLSAEGRLHTCLFALKGHDLRAPAPARGLRRGARRAHPRHLGPPHRPLFRAPDGRDGGPAEGRDVLHRRVIVDPRPPIRIESVTAVVAAGRRDSPARLDGISASRS